MLEDRVTEDSNQLGIPDEMMLDGRNTDGWTPDSRALVQRTTVNSTLGAPHD